MTHASASIEVTTGRGTPHSLALDIPQRDRRVLSEMLSMTDIMVRRGKARTETERARGGPPPLKCMKHDGRKKLRTHGTHCSMKYEVLQYSYEKLRFIRTLEYKIARLVRLFMKDVRQHERNFYPLPHVQLRSAAETSRSLLHYVSHT